MAGPGEDFLDFQKMLKIEKDKDKADFKRMDEMIDDFQARGKEIDRRLEEHRKSQEDLKEQIEELKQSIVKK